MWGRRLDRDQGMGRMRAGGHVQVTSDACVSENGRVDVCGTRGGGRDFADALLLLLVNYVQKLLINCGTPYGAGTSVRTSSRLLMCGPWGSELHRRPSALLSSSFAARQASQRKSNQCMKNTDPPFSPCRGNARVPTSHRQQLPRRLSPAPRRNQIRHGFHPGDRCAVCHGVSSVVYSNLAHPPPLAPLSEGLSYI